MIATTIINSMRVNPLWIFFFILSVATPSLAICQSKRRAMPAAAARFDKLAEVFVTPHDPDAENCHRRRQRAA
jgi:hypothetical protein